MCVQRLERLDGLQEEMVVLRERMGEVARTEDTKRLFVKPEATLADMSINKWSLYTTYRCDTRPQHPQ